MEGKLTLHKWPESWGLPSLSAACIQAEAYLRFAGATFVVEPCSTPNKSPTGQLPAVEQGAEVSAHAESDYAAARDVIAFAKKHVKDLDATLTAGQRAELFAFTHLVETKLDAATAFSVWCESTGFKEHKQAAYDGKLPFPLSYVVPWSQQREMKRKLEGLDAGKVYEDACQVLAALADCLRASNGPFFFGSQPSSLDALILGHLLYYRVSPAAAPVLQKKVSSYQVLVDYLDRAMSKYFASPAPLASQAGGASSSSWSEAAQGRKTSPKVEPSPTELEMRKYSKYWLLGAGAAVLSYILLSGRYIQVVTLQNALGMGDDGDDDDDDDEDDE